MRSLDLKPTHKPIQNYYSALRQFDDLGVSHEGAVNSAFRSLSDSNEERARVRCRSELSDFSQKQQFLNTVYEKFFQGFCVKVADTHGIVYAPPSIVSFMVRSVDELLGQTPLELHRTPDNNRCLLQHN